MAESPVRFEQLIDRYHDEIYRYLWRLLKTGQSFPDIEIADVVQEVFIRAYRGFARLRPGSNHRAWLYKIATNYAYTTLKQNRRRHQCVEPFDVHEFHLADAAPSQLEQILRREALQTAGEAIQKLPPKQRTALVLRYLQELSYAEIATAMTCSEDAARANVYQALRSLRRMLAPDETREQGG